MSSILTKSGLRVRSEQEIDDILLFGAHVSSLDFSNMGDIQVPFALILKVLYSKDSDINKNTLSISKIDIIKAIIDEEPLNKYQKIHAAIYLDYSYSLEEYFSAKTNNNSESMQGSFVPLRRTRKHEDDFLIKNQKNIYHMCNMFGVSVYNPIFSSMKFIKTILYQDDIYRGIDLYKNMGNDIYYKIKQLYNANGKVKNIEELILICNTQEQT